MIRLPKGASINGFCDTIIFELPDYVGEVLQQRKDLASVPHFALLRRGRIAASGKNIQRQDVKQLIQYLLLHRDPISGKLQATRRITGEKVGSILGNMSQYVTAEGDLYTAKKYFNVWQQKGNEP